MNTLRISQGIDAGRQAVVIEVPGARIADKRVWVDQYSDRAEQKEERNQTRSWFLKNTAIIDGKMYISGVEESVFVAKMTSALLTSYITLSLEIAFQGDAVGRRTAWTIGNDGRRRLFGEHGEGCIVHASHSDLRYLGVGTNGNG